MDMVSLNTESFLERLLFVSTPIVSIVLDSSFTVISMWKLSAVVLAYTLLMLYSRGAAVVGM